MHQSACSEAPLRQWFFGFAFGLTAMATFHAEFHWSQEPWPTHAIQSNQNADFGYACLLKNPSAKVTNYDFWQASHSLFRSRLTHRQFQARNGSCFRENKRRLRDGLAGVDLIQDAKSKVDSH